MIIVANSFGWSFGSGNISFAPNPAATSIMVWTPMLYRKKLNKNLLNDGICLSCSQTSLNSWNPFIKIFFLSLRSVFDVVGSTLKVIWAKPNHHKPVNKKDNRTAVVPVSLKPNHVGLRMITKQISCNKTLPTYPK